MTTTRTPFRILDIETAPNPEAVAKFTDPFPVFFESEVKVGNLKDPEKIREKLQAARTAHAQEAQDYWSKAAERAALHPFTGTIEVIGIMDEGGEAILIDGPEATLLARFWSLFGLPGDPSLQWLVYSGCGDERRNFDLDFILTRSRILGVAIPPHIRPGRYYSDRITDLAPLFLLHRHDAFCSLTKCAELLGCYDRPIETDAGPVTLTRKRQDDEVTGANFFEFWRSPGERQRKAQAYLINDLFHTLAIARRLL